MSEIDEGVRKYREAAIGTSMSVPAAKANESGRRLHAHYLSLRQTPAGRDAITTMLSDEDLNVRLWAARHGLEWVPDVAEGVLDELAQGGGLLSFTAEMTLKEYKKGRLKFGPAAGGTGEND